jgi:uncharacterized protein YjbI with pentapeptide repeats
LNRFAILNFKDWIPASAGMTQRKTMPTQLTSGQYVADNANLASSKFNNVNLSKSTFTDVNLRDTVFDNVALTNATIRNACLGNLTIADASYEGMRIEGILVTDLLRVYREHVK